MTDINTAIHGFLDELEQKHDITIAYAAELSSRAYGLDGPDSDYDISIIYTHNNIRAYARLEERTSSLQTDHPDPNKDIEVQGWDLNQYMRLLADSNEHAIDTLRTDIIYHSTFDHDALTTYITNHYNPIALYHTYRSIAKNMYRKFISDHLYDSEGNNYDILARSDDGWIINHPEDGKTHIDKTNEKYDESQTKRTVKRNLYIMKYALYAKQLRVSGENGEHELPSLNFQQFLDTQAPQLTTEKQLDMLHTLAEQKRNGDGSKEIGAIVSEDLAFQPKEIDHEIHARDGPDIDVLNDFIDTILDNT